ncbi:MAG TPA: DeoR/GlpR family DNA-binding transcription regulator [Steroidobacteraceae bacterium]|jgi:DeoR/GlpR family transcriptional regulator of sugar metabolism|nr:DeoR/GlpR family DNA-binding transcription regulator [Steroidobacteraceae bacterium]
MLASQRKDYLLQVLQTQGQIVAKDLSQELQLSEDTIRRDLRELAAAGRLQRVHGGALPASPAVVDFAGRQQIASDAKVAIGRAAAQMIQRGQVVILDGGTTTAQIARHLPHDLRATIVTHSPTIAVALVEHPSIEVILLGGRLFKHSVVTVGAAAVEAVARIRADLYFMGVTGIHPKAGLSTGDLEESHMKRALMASAAETHVLASAEKVGTASPYVICPLADVDGLVVAPDIPKKTLAEYRKLGLSVVQA